MVAGVDHAVHDGEARSVGGAGTGVLEVLGLGGDGSPPTPASSREEGDGWAEDTLRC
jgi:hypothetical protein